jgi:hypothetical protein
MNINSKIAKYLGVQDISLNEQMSDDELLDKMVDFLADLDDEVLDDDMAARLEEILDTLDSDEDEDENESEGEVSEKKTLHRTKMSDRRESRMYYKRNKVKIKMRLKKLKAKRERLAKMGRGLSGKRLGLTKRAGTHAEQD